MSKNYELLARESAGTQPVLSVVDHYPTTLPAPATARQDTADDQPPDAVLALKVLRRYWRGAAIFAGLVYLAVVAVTLLTKPEYEPVAELEILPPGTEAFSLSSPTTSVDSTEFIGTQIRMLQSDQLAIDLIREKHLDSLPEFSGGKRNVRAGDRESSLTATENAALESFHSKLTVKRDSASSIVRVSFASYDPNLAASVTNRLIERFIDSSYQARLDAAVESSRWLSKQLDDIREKMNQSEKALAAFQEKHGIVDVDDKQSTLMQQVGELNRSLADAQSERIKLQSFVDSIRAGREGTLPQVRDNIVVQQLTQKLADAKTQLADAKNLYGSSHVVIRKLEGQVTELQAQLEAQKEAVVGSIITSFSSAQSRERLMGQQVRSTAAMMDETAQYAALKKDVEVDTQLYNALYSRVKEAGIAAAAKSNNVRIVDRARVLNSPTHPKTALNLFGGFFGSLLLGVVFAFSAAAFDTHIRAPEDVRRCSGIHNVAVLPSLRSKELNSCRGGEYAAGRMLLEVPRSEAAEAIRGIDTSLMVTQMDRNVKIVAVLSAMPREGKSTVSANLAIAMARHNTVCIVDADMRRPSIANIFGCQPRYGLSDVLLGRATVEEALFQCEQLPNLAILHAGAQMPETSPMVLPAEMTGLISELRSKFSRVIIDSPPVLSCPDAGALAKFADGLVFVAFSGRTTREALNRSMELLADAHAAPIVQFVLNGSNARSSYYKYYRYSS